MRGLIVAMLMLPGALALAEAPVATLKVDLDAVKAAGAVQPVNGLSSSGQPDAEALDVFADSGYAAVIDLRGASETRGLDEPQAVAERGMTYVPFPIPGSDDITFENAGALKALIDAQSGPVLLHCGSGNRVGAMLALIASLEGADDDAALAYGREGGMTRLEPVVRERLAGDE